MAFWGSVARWAKDKKTAGRRLYNKASNEVSFAAGKGYSNIEGKGLTDRMGRRVLGRWSGRPWKVRRDIENLALGGAGLLGGTMFAGEDMDEEVLDAYIDILHDPKTPEGVKRQILDILG